HLHNGDAQRPAAGGGDIDDLQQAVTGAPRRAHRVTADSSTPRPAYLIALTSRRRSVSALADALPLPRVGRVTTPLPLYRLCLLIVDPSQESELLRVNVCHTHPLTNRS